MKLGNLQVINVKRGMTIRAKAETKKSLPTKKEKEDEPKAPIFKDLVEDKTIHISENSYIVVSASSLEGEDDSYVDIRMYKKTDKYNGPTKRGIRIHVEFLEDLLNALNELDEELDELGI